MNTTTESDVSADRWQEFADECRNLLDAMTPTGREMVKMAFRRGYIAGGIDFLLRLRAEGEP